MVVVMATGCAGMKKRKGGGGGGGGQPREGGGGGGAPGNRQADRDRDQIQRLVDERDELQRLLDDKLNNENNPFVQRGIANTDINPNQFAIPNGGFAQLPGADPNVIGGNPLDSGVGVNLDPNAPPQVQEAGFSPLIQVGNPEQPVALRSSATRRPVSAPVRGLASHK